MAKELKLRRGTTAEHSTFTGAEGEVTVDTTKDTVVVHDGTTAGGVPLAKEADIPSGALASLDSVDASTIDDNSVGAAEINVTGNGTSGQYLASDGDGTMTWTDLPGGGGFSNMEVFNNPGTWTNPGNIEKVKVTVVGGGGNGGPGPKSSGGGGGGTAIEVIPFPSATNVPVTVGNAAGTSSFGAYCSATGGSSAPGGTRGVGGSGSGGQLNIGGGSGTGFSECGANIDQGGVGGSSAFGAGGESGQYSGWTGGAGKLYGGGGGGNGEPTPSTTAKAGAKGVVVVEY